MRQHPQSKAPNQSLVEPSFASFAGLKILVIYSTKTTFFVSGNFYRRFAFFSLRIHSQLWRFCHPHSCCDMQAKTSENGPRCSCWQPPWRRRLLNLLDLCCSSEFSVILMAIIHIIPSVIKRGKSCVCYCKNLELKRKKFCLLMQIRQET